VWGFGKTVSNFFGCARLASMKKDILQGAILKDGLLFETQLLWGLENEEQ
jgi:hypothetical protein